MVCVLIAYTAVTGDPVHYLHCICSGNSSQSLQLHLPKVSEHV